MSCGSLRPRSVLSRQALAASRSSRLAPIARKAATASACPTGGRPGRKKASLPWVMTLASSRMSELRRRGLTPVLLFVAELVAIVSGLGAPLIPALAEQVDISISAAQWALAAAVLEDLTEPS